MTNLENETTEGLYNTLETNLEFAHQAIVKLEHERTLMLKTLRDILEMSAKNFSYASIHNHALKTILEVEGK